MPDTLTPERLAAIRKGAEASPNYPPSMRTVRELLSHIDALTAAVEGLPPHKCQHGTGEPVHDTLDRAAVLAILRGES